MIFHESTRHVIVKQTQAPAYLIDLMHDKNAEIRKVCENTLDIIAEVDPEWTKKIQTEKFRWHNSQWLEMIESQANEEEVGFGYDSANPYIQGTEAFDRPEYMFADYNDLLDGSVTSDFIDEPSVMDGRSFADYPGMPSGNEYYERPQSHFGYAEPYYTDPYGRPISRVGGY